MVGITATKKNKEKRMKRTSSKTNICIIGLPEEKEERMVEFTAVEQNKEKRMKRKEDSRIDLWDNIKLNNIHIIGVPEGEETEKGPKKIFEEIIVKDFPNMGKEIASQVQEAQRVPYRINPRRNMPRHLVTKLAKIKDKENY